jgi:hypothetical protein
MKAFSLLTFKYFIPQVCQFRVGSFNFPANKITFLNEEYKVTPWNLTELNTFPD